MLRVVGTAVIHVAPDFLAEFGVDGKLPRSVLVVTVEAVFFQCSRAVLRSNLWDQSKNVSHDELPSPGKILADLSKGEVDGLKYDWDLPERLESTLY